MQEVKYKKNLQNSVHAQEATQKVSFASYGRRREEAQRGKRRGIYYVDEEKHSTGPGEEKTDDNLILYIPTRGDGATSGSVVTVHVSSQHCLCTIEHYVMCIIIFDAILLFLAMHY